jgi:NADH:ubiquinone oxidoreductase subunit E
MTTDGSTNEEDRRIVRETLSHYSGHRGALLMALLDVQYKLGYIPETTVEDAAELLDYSHPEVWGVLTFYSDFKVGKEAGHFVDVCIDTPCHVGGAREIWSALEEARKSPEGNPSFQLRRTSCPRLCSQAPLIAVDMRWRGRMTVERAREFVAGLD